MPETLEAPAATPERKSKPAKPPVFYLREWAPNRGHVNRDEGGQVIAGSFRPELAISTCDLPTLTAIDTRRGEHCEATLKAVRKTEQEFLTTPAHLTYSRTRDHLRDTEAKAATAEQEANRLEGEILEAIQSGKSASSLRQKFDDRVS